MDPYERRRMPPEIRQAFALEEIAEQLRRLAELYTVEVMKDRPKAGRKRATEDASVVDSVRKR